jgi:hypothetical protein
MFFLFSLSKKRSRNGGNCDTQESIARMSTVLKFQRPYQRESGPSLLSLRPPDILINVAALVAQVEALQIQTTEDLRQAIFILDLANNSIRLIIRQINMDETARTILMVQSARIDQLIEAVRKEAPHLFEKND